jgi:hypothetical protein
MQEETIYMPLLNEGVLVWAPIQAESLGEGLFLVLGPMPSDQQWQFGPGSIVRAQMHDFSGGERGVAAFEIAALKH